MKGVASCDKLGVAACRFRTRDSRIGLPSHFGCPGNWTVTRWIETSYEAQEKKANFALRQAFDCYDVLRFP